MFNKDVKVPLQEAELVGASSSNRLAGGNSIKSNSGPGASNGHLINNAFDDLLGLEMPQSLASPNAVLAQVGKEVKVATPKEKKQKKDKQCKKSKKKE